MTTGCQNDQSHQGEYPVEIIGKRSMDDTKYAGFWFNDTAVDKLEAHRIVEEKERKHDHQRYRPDEQFGSAAPEMFTWVMLEKDGLHKISDRYDQDRQGGADDGHVSDEKNSVNELIGRRVESWGDREHSEIESIKCKDEDYKEGGHDPPDLLLGDRRHDEQLEDHTQPPIGEQQEQEIAKKDEMHEDEQDRPGWGPLERLRKDNGNKTISRR